MKFIISHCLTDNLFSEPFQLSLKISERQLLRCGQFGEEGETGNPDGGGGEEALPVPREWIRGSLPRGLPPTLPHLLKERSPKVTLEDDRDLGKMQRYFEVFSPSLDRGAN